MYSKEITTKASNIKLLALDVDGVLTDGSIIFDNQGMEIKKFNVKDGLGINRLIKAGIILAIITARESNIVLARAKDLGIHHVYQNMKDKTLALDALLSEHGIQEENIAYVGDDIPDLKVLERVGLPCCPADAVDEVKSVACFVSSRPGGHGAVREIADLIYNNMRVDTAKSL